jgi:cephalosporin-C deacetylase-like acetyl esterase
MKKIILRVKLFCLLTVATFATLFALAQPPEKFINISVVPDHSDWLYTLGEKANFTVSITQSGVPIAVTNVRYAVMPEKMPKEKSGMLKLQNGVATLEAGSMKNPGFLRVEVEADYNGKIYKGIGTAAFEPEKIQPTVKTPADFTAFWEKEKADLAKIPLQPKLTLVPEKCTDLVNVYHVSFRNFGYSRMFGMLCMPKKEGKYPALLHVPGAGIRPYTGDIANAEKGVITLQIGIHGIPVNLDPDVYVALAEGALKNYPGFNLDTKETSYYRRVYLGCVRAVDFLSQLPQTDTARIGINGGSQGGALSIITATLDSRIKYLTAYYPAMSDMTGYLEGRAGGWPHLFAGQSLALMNKPEKIATVGYYDVVSFAKNLKTPGYYSLGFNDETCPPTSMYAAYNQIKAPKNLFIVQATGHWTYPEQTEKLMGWMLQQLGVGRY